MIDAGQAGDIVLLLEAHQRALVSAAVDHRVDLAVMILVTMNWRSTDHRCAIAEEPLESGPYLTLLSTLSWR